jgi:hypothetical protein
VLFLVASFTCALFYFIAPTSTPWLHQTYGQIAVSFAALTVLFSLMFVAVPRLRRFDRKYAVSHTIRVISLISFMVSVIAFAIFGYITATSHNNSASLAALLAFRSVFPIGMFGVFGLMLFACAFICLMVYFLDKGSLRAFKDAMRFFVFPALMVFELWLLLVDTKEMPLHVTMFLGSTPLSGVLTNWFVFVVSSGLVALGLAYKRLTLKP